MLNEVRLLKHDTCYTYALKRVGIDTLENLRLESNEFISKFLLETVEEKDLKEGDILCYVWEDDPIRKLRAEYFISPEREILIETKYHNVHFMVYEGNGIISHAIGFSENGFNSHRICMRRLRDGEPDWFRIKCKE